MGTILILLFLFAQLGNDQLMLRMKQINRKSSNSRVNQSLLTEASWIFLSRSFCTKSLTRENSAKAFIRGTYYMIRHYKTNTISLFLCITLSTLCKSVWKVMEMCYSILLLEKRVTQRELFYKLLCSSPDYFTTQLQVNQTIQG